VAVGPTSQLLFSQYRKLSVTACAGYSTLNLGGVDEKNQSDVVGWAAQGIPVSQFASLKRSPFYSAGVSYRFEREFALSLSWSYWRKTVSSSYDGPDAKLRLDRGVGATDIVLGIAYYPGAQPYFLEWYFRANAGLEFARATATAVGSRHVILGAVTPFDPFIETNGLYTKTYANAGIAVGADVPLFRGAFLRAEATYRFANVGAMDGEITSFGERTVETSSIGFNFSGLLLGAGIKFEL
jgi:hypothetical protein